MWTAENEMDCCLNSVAQTWEHSDPSNFFVCVSSPVILVVAIILLSFPLYCRLSLVTTRNIFKISLTFDFEEQLQRVKVHRWRLTM